MKNNFKTFGKLISVLMIGVLLFCAFAVGISAAVTATAETFISSDTMDFENGYSGRINTKYALVDGDTGKAMKLTIGSNAENLIFELTNNSGTALTLNDGKVYAVSVSYKVDRIGGDDEQAPTIINLVRTTESGDGIVKVKNFPEAAFYVGDTTDWVTSTVVFKASVASSPEFNRIAINVVSGSCPSTLSTAEENNTVVQFDNISVTECTENTKSIDFYSNGGSYCDTLLAQPGEAITLPTPVRDLYNFEGWYTDSELKKAFNSTAMPDSLTTKLYAKWSVSDEAVTVSFSGAGNITSLVGREGDAITLPKLSRDNFHFAGWYNKELSERQDLSVFPKGDITLYAKWEAIPKLCNFENTDAIPKPDNAKFTQRCILVTNDKYRGNQSVHYSFQRGFELTGSSGKNTPAGVILVDEDGEYIALEPGTKYVVTFRYKVVKYNSNGWITLISASNSNAWSGRKVQDKDCVLQYDASDINKGWQAHSFTVTWDPQSSNSNYAYIGIAGDSEIYVDEISVYEYADNVTVDDSKAMLIFETGDDTIMDTVYAERGTEYTLPQPQKDGYRFLGWYYDADCTKQVESDTVTLDKICTVLYAEWYKIPPITESSEPEAPIEDTPAPVTEDTDSNNNTTMFIIIAVVAAAVVIIAAVAVIIVVKSKKKKQSETVENSQQDGQDNKE